MHFGTAVSLVLAYVWERPEGQSRHGNFGNFFGSETFRPWNGDDFFGTVFSR